MQKSGEFKYLEEQAINVGAVAARVVPADRIVVEDRVVLKCKSGCPSYGTCLKCPPYVPSPGEFRKMLGEYRFAMVVKHQPPAMSGDLAAGLTRVAGSSPLVGTEVKAKLRSYMVEYGNKVLSVMLELETAAFNCGNTFAVALVGGSCRLCEKCNVETGLCRYPSRARIAAEAIGVNMMKTAENAGMSLSFHPGKPPEPMAILLID
jgi:predicted metal-binding protein